MRWSLLVALLAFLLPQELPLEFYPLTDPAPGTLYLEFKGRFEAPNWLDASEQLEHYHWWKPQGISCVADALNAPDGKKTAEIFQASTKANGLLTLRGYGGLPGEERTFSVYAKKINHRYLALSFGSRCPVWPFFDFDTGRCTNLPGSGFTLRAIPVGADWWRLSLSGKVPSAFDPSAGLVGLWLVNAKGTPYSPFSGSEKVAVWGTQVERGTVASAYAPTVVDELGLWGGRFTFQPDFGRGYLTVREIVVPIAHSVLSYTYIFPLSDTPLRGLRLTPVDRPGQLAIDSLRLIDRSGREIHRFPRTAFLPSSGTQIGVLGEAWTLRAEPAAPDPYATVLLLRVFVPEGMATRNLQRCLQSWSYLTGMLTLLLVTVAWLFRPGHRLERRALVRLLLFLVLLAGAFSAVANRGLIKQSLAAARLEAAERSATTPAGLR